MELPIGVLLPQFSGEWGELVHVTPCLPREALPADNVEAGATGLADRVL